MRNKLISELKTFYVWGSGPVRSELIRGSKHSPDGAAYVLEKGHLKFSDCDDWCIEITCTEEELDAATRHNDNVYGYIETDEISENDIQDISEAFREYREGRTVSIDIEEEI